MALLQCPDCGNEISDSAAACPQCGRPAKIPTGTAVGQAKTNRLAITALVLAILGYLTIFFGIGFLFCIAAFIIGLIALPKIKDDPLQKGYGMALAAVIMGSLSFFILLIAVPIAIPSFVKYKAKSVDAQAKVAGKMVQIAEQDYKLRTGTYTSDLDKLAPSNPNIASDPQVTFVFQHASKDIFSLYTQHAKGTGATFPFTEK